jgi:hypothetical protein
MSRKGLAIVIFTSYDHATTYNEFYWFAFQSEALLSEDGVVGIS